MVEAKIVDTNVPLVAASTEKWSIDCQKACLEVIRRILRGEILLILDDAGEVLQEYRNQMYPDPNPSAGLASQFLMYVLTNQGNQDRVQRVPLPKNAEGEYAHFPNDPRVGGFDRSDRKWVAISVGYRHNTGLTAPIVNATDSDWLHFEAIFEELGIVIEFLCREDLKNGRLPR